MTPDPTPSPPVAAVRELGEPAVRVLRRFRQVFNAVKTHFQQVEKRAGIGGAQLWALSLVQAHPGIGVGALSRGMDVHQSTASNLVKMLTALGLLEARKGGADRRAVQLHLLPAGERVLQKAPSPFAGVLPQALAHLDTKTLNRLEQDLATLIDQLQATEQDAGIPLGHD